jgi:hypothetical protein
MVRRDTPSISAAWSIMMDAGMPRGKRTIDARRDDGRSASSCRPVNPGVISPDGNSLLAG